MDSSVERVDDLVTRLLPIVREVMDVSRWQPGGHGREYRARFAGRLRIDSAEAFNRLKPQFAAEGVTLMLRQEEQLQVFLAVDRVPEDAPSRIWVNLALALTTVATVLWVGLQYGQGYAQDNPPSDALGRPITLALIYAISLLGILGAHEFGHYLMGRYRNFKVSLPYFIPSPLLPFGTFGAFIKLKSRPRNRNDLLDMGLAGPYAGLAVALPLLILGLSLSEVGTIEAPPPGAIVIQEGNSILYLALKFIIKGELLPMPVDFQGLSPALYWLQNIAAGIGGQLGVPIPLGGRDVQLHPMAIAAWAGLFVTGINLIPAGQLDGGHSIYTLLGPRAKRIWPFVVVGFVLLILVWRGWFLFAAFVFLLGRTYAQPLDDVTELTSGRKVAAILAIVVFILTFTPVPLIFIPGL